MKTILSAVYLVSIILIAALIAICVLLASIGSDSLHRSLLALNIAIYVVIASVIYRKKYLIYFDAWFVILFPFYYSISYIFSVHYGFTALGSSQDTAGAVLVLCLSTWIISCILLLLRPKAISPSLFFQKFSDSINYIRSKPTTFIIIFPLALCVAFFFIKSVANMSFSQLLTQSRLELLHQVSESGWYLKYFIIAYAWFSIFYLISLPSKKTLSKIYLFIPVLIYVVSLILIGSRREIVFIIIFSFGCFYIYSHGDFSKKQIAVAAILLGGILFLGMLRSRDEYALEVYINAFGEFLFPISTLYYYIENETLNFSSGSSYLQFFYNFIPKAILPEKPASLAVEFAHLVAPPNADYIMGYAFTPITEAYLNFGFSCFFILPIIIAGTSFLIELISKSYPMVTIVFLSQVLNFQRGELASFFFEVVLLTVCLFACFMLSRGRLR